MLREANNAFMRERKRAKRATPQPETGPLPPALLMIVAMAQRGVKAPFAHGGEAELVFGSPAYDPALCAAAIQELEPGGSNRLVEL